MSSSIIFFCTKPEGAGAFQMNLQMNCFMLMENIQLAENDICCSINGNGDGFLIHLLESSLQY